MVSTRLTDLQLTSLFTQRRVNLLGRPMVPILDRDDVRVVPLTDETLPAFRETSRRVIEECETRLGSSIQAGFMEPRNPSWSNPISIPGLGDWSVVSYSKIDGTFLSVQNRGRKAIFIDLPKDGSFNPFSPFPHCGVFSHRGDPEGEGWSWRVDRTESLSEGKVSTTQYLIELSAHLLCGTAGEVQSFGHLVLKAGLAAAAWGPYPAESLGTIRAALKRGNAWKTVVLAEGGKVVPWPQGKSRSDVRLVYSEPLDGNQKKHDESPEMLIISERVGSHVPVPPRLLVYGSRDESSLTISLRRPSDDPLEMSSFRLDFAMALGEGAKALFET